MERTVLKEPLTHELPNGQTAIRLEAIEEFLNVACNLEEAINKISDIVDRKEVNDSLAKAPNLPVIQAFLDIKKIVKDLT